MGFTPQEASTPKEPDLTGKSKTTNGRPPDLSTIMEKTEVGSQWTSPNIIEYQKKMKETPSISSSGEPPQEISTQEVDKAYKKKNAYSQRLTTIYHNWNIEKELAKTELEKQAIDEFYEGLK